MESPVLVDEAVRDSLRIILIDVPFENFVNAIRTKEEYVHHTRYTSHRSIMLSGDDFLQNIEVVPSSAESLDKEYEFDDYFSSGEEEETVSVNRTEVFVTQYGALSELSEETGRDYTAEKDAVLEFAVEVAERVQENI